MVDSVDRLVSEAEQREARDHLYRLAVITLTARQFADTPEGAARAVVDAVLGSGEAVYVALGVGEERDRLREAIEGKWDAYDEDGEPLLPRGWALVDGGRLDELEASEQEADRLRAVVRQAATTPHENYSPEGRRVALHRIVTAARAALAGPENPKVTVHSNLTTDTVKKIESTENYGAGPENPEEDER